MSTRQAGVLGHPIAHSLSPVLHQSAYRALGLDWEYDKYDVTEDQLAEFLAGLDDAWAGLSLTMPLKVAAMPLLDYVEPMAKLVGAVNTVLLQPQAAGRHVVGANTDVHGIAAALQEGGVTEARDGLILGGGATATSAMAALGRLGVTRPVIVVRNRARAGGLLRAATKMGVEPRFVPFEDAPALMATVPVVVSTVPASVGEGVASALDSASSSPDNLSVREGAVLLDAVYDPITTPLGRAWSAHGGTFVNGTRMLLHQAAEQIRLMTGHEAPIDVMDRALLDALAETH
ncbi:shikimate dehydrogenase [Demequina sediminicola]|uniref:shikimate dehydrogenase n=1 Tax=Demequina sediminicola TaxID=1095026 RepID=UPI000785D6D2|nr:shikimate dehydrogenase [Demequina sediminicola]